MQTTHITVTDKYHWQLSRLSWGAVIAGCVVALSVHLLLSMLGIGLGVRMVNPFTDENPVLGFTTAVGVAWTVSALISLWVGGWVAGRTSGQGYGNIGGLHGVVVWGVATVTSAVILTAGAGMLAGGAISLVGKVGAGAAAGAAANPQIASTMDFSGPGSLPQAMQSFLDEALMRNGSGASTSGGVYGNANTSQGATYGQGFNYTTTGNNPSYASTTGTSPDQTGMSSDAATRAASDGTSAAANTPANAGSNFNYARARREVGAAIYRDYSDRSDTNRTALVQAIVQYTGKSEADANAMVAQWDQAADRLEEELKVAADNGRRALVKVAAWTFLAFAVGAFAAAWGGFCGARRASKFYVLTSGPVREADESPSFSSRAVNA